MTSALRIACSACRVIDAPSPLALGSQPPVSTTEKLRPFHRAS
jgi:hypothetical protein